MQVNYFKTTKTARYFQLGEFSEETKYIWFVLHGYMQLAEYFIAKFRHLDNGRNVIIAPEALSRDYISGSKGRVGASWMTKEDRLIEIEDYINYLDGLSEKILNEHPHPEAKIIVLGFSQGVATATRWVFDGKIKPQHLALWSGVFPPDMETNLSKEAMREMKITTLVGDEDPYYSNAAENKNPFELLDKSEIEFHHIAFKGGHNIYEEPLKKLAEIVES